MFPKHFEHLNICRMYKNIERLQIAKGPKHFNFVPKTFMIPNEYSEFAATHHRMRGELIVFDPSSLPDPSESIGQMDDAMTLLK